MSSVLSGAALAAGPSAGTDTRLITAALVGIALIIALITFFKLHPFLSLIIGAILVGAIAGRPLDKTVTSFGTGVGPRRRASAR